MTLQPMPQFSDQYEGDKIRYMVQVLENALKDFSQVDLLSQMAPVIYPQFTSQGNTGATETTLYSGVVSPARYYNPGWQIKVQAFGTFAGNSNTKELKLYLNNIVIYDSTALAINGGTWSLDLLLIITGASTEQILVTVMSSNSTLADTVIYSAGTVAMGSTNTIALTGTGIATNDIVGQAMILTTQPN